MISERLLSDRITILKANGEKFENISASVQKKIYINEVELPIEDGDTIEQTLPSGVVKKLLVTDVNVASGMSGPDHVEISYEKVR